MITKVALDRLSRSLHSDVCDSDGLRDAAIHSTISGSGGRRDCAASNNYSNKNKKEQKVCEQSSEGKSLKNLDARISPLQNLHGLESRGLRDWGLPFLSYLLGLLAMIKCSICSYQYDN